MMAANARPTRATKMNRLARSIAVVHILFCLFVAPFASAAETVDCHVGIYRMSNGTTVDIALPIATPCVGVASTAVRVS
jgi:hypothetical protein